MQSTTIRNPHCTACALHKNAKNVCLVGDVARTYPLMLVLTSPTKNDDRKGIVMQSEWMSAGISEALYYTTAVKCYAPNEPTLAEAEACRTYLVQEIARVQPQVILAMGNTALKTLTGTSGIAKLRGKVLKLRATLQSELRPLSPVVFASWTPSYVNDTPAKASELEADIEGALRYVRNGDWTDDVPFVIV